MRLLIPARGSITTTFTEHAARRPGYAFCGVDFSWSTSADWRIGAAGNGRVIFAGWSGADYGNLVVIDHGNGVTTWYAHLESIAVSVGDSVRAGQQIGVMGATGNAQGRHLHFELRINGVQVDPEPYLTSTAFSGDITELPIREDDMAEIYEDAGSGDKPVNTGRFFAGAPGAWVEIDNRDFGGDRFVRELLESKFGPIKLTWSGELVGIRKTWLALAPAAAVAIDYAALADALAAKLNIPTAAENGAAAREAIVK